jgi:hypothetical protein
LVAKKPKKPSLMIVTSSEPTGPQPPRSLGEHGLTLWQNVMSECEIEDVGGLEVLAQICGAKDRLEAMRTQIDADGETIIVKGVPKPHPLLRDEIQIRAFICRGLARLGLNLEAVKPVGRPNNWS